MLPWLGGGEQSADRIWTEHLSEAINYRSPDRHNRGNETTEWRIPVYCSSIIFMIMVKFNLI